jgi:pyruvate/2-oxoglutarate dehydrogenase complex dihydrolipoamide acyltransferase (E2) component
MAAVKCCPFTTAEIETDKATLAFENQDDGFIAKIVKPGGMVATLVLAR